MFRGTLALSLLALVTPVFALGLPGGQGAVEAWTCPGSKTIAIWFWPSGHGKTSLGVATPTPHVELFTGASATAGAGNFIADAVAIADAISDGGVRGGLCAPRGTIEMAASPSGTQSSTAKALTCRLPVTPLLGNDRVSRTHARLRVVLPSGRLVAAVDMKPKGSTLVYAGALCRQEPRPDHTRP